MYDILIIFLYCNEFLCWSRTFQAAVPMDDDVESIHVYDPGGWNLNVCMTNVSELNFSVM